MSEAFPFMTPKRLPNAVLGNRGLGFSILTICSGVSSIACCRACSSRLWFTGVLRNPAGPGGQDKASRATVVRSEMPVGSQERVLAGLGGRY
jgi:hypothetical protein